MSHIHSSTPSSPGLTVFGNLICFLCLGVSAVQAATWIYDNVPDPDQRWVFIAGIITILLGSQAIVRKTFHAWQNGNNKLVVRWGVLTVLLIECVSIFMSNMSFDGNLLESRRHQNMESREYSDQVGKINDIKIELASLRETRRNTKAQERTNREHLTGEIRYYERLVERETRKLAHIDVSTSGAALDRLEDNFGISQGHMTFFFSLMLSLVHLTWALLDASFLWSAKALKTARTAVKKRRPKLRAVAA